MCTIQPACDVPAQLITFPINLGRKLPINQTASCPGADAVAMGDACVKYSAALSATSHPIEAAQRYIYSASVKYNFEVLIILLVDIVLFYTAIDCTVKLN